ncbi:hypothetical protein ILYODFUR_026709 [Ilyodon furcidens]|uniref:Uncharacterized protein n=2 Tax=Goodeidae TaxID=28758 RepID=A0ABV0V9A4_9TELE
MCALSDFREYAFAYQDCKQLFDPHQHALSLSFLSVKLTCNEAGSSLCWFNCANVWVPSRGSAPSAAECGASACCVREVLPVVPLSDSGDRSKETVQESSDSRDISEADTEARAPEASSEVIYDDVPSEEALSPLEDMIYEDVQRESGPLEANNGWSSSEFESYDEQSDNDAKLPARSKLSPEVHRLRERCARTKRELAMRLSGKNYDIKV